MLYLKYIGTGGTTFDYPVYEDLDNNLYFDTSFGNADTPTLYTGAFVDCFGEIRGEPDKAIIDIFEIAPEENTWEVPDRLHRREAAHSACILPLTRGCQGRETQHIQPPRRARFLQIVVCVCGDRQRNHAGWGIKRHCISCRGKHPAR